MDGGKVGKEVKEREMRGKRGVEKESEVDRRGRKGELKTDVKGWL